MRLSECNRRRLLSVGRQVCFLLWVLPLVATADNLKARMNGFVLEAPLIPIEQIYQGGPPRDGIPSIDTPAFVAASDASFLHNKDRVLGVTFNGVSKAYGILILNYHELVNDTFDGHPVLVSFCPLCGTGMAFNAIDNERRRSFGVSGLLYNSDLLMYDRQTESLWSQIEGKAISGREKGKTLERLPVEHTTWESWKSRHPNTLVLSDKTGFSRDYSGTPYHGYDQVKTVYFPVANQDKRYHPKEVVVGVEIAGMVKAYPFVELAKGDGVLQDSFSGQRFTVNYDAEARSARVVSDGGTLLPSLTAFWFAWIAFHPDTEVYTHTETFND